MRMISSRVKCQKKVSSFFSLPPNSFFSSFFYYTTSSWYFTYFWWRADVFLAEWDVEKQGRKIEEVLYFWSTISPFSSTILGQANYQYLDRASLLAFIHVSFGIVSQRQLWTNCFSVVCSYGLIVSQMLKWYGLGSIVFYIFALRANGGVEKLEMAVFQAFHNSNKK